MTEEEREREVAQPGPFLSMRASVNHRVKRTKDSNSSLTVSPLSPHIHQFWRLSYYNRLGIWGLQDHSGSRCVEGRSVVSAWENFSVKSTRKYFHRVHCSVLPFYRSFGY